MSQAAMYETSLKLGAAAGEDRAKVIRSVLDKLAESRPDASSIVGLAKTDLAEATAFVRTKGLVTLFDQSGGLEAKAQTVQRFAETQPGEAQHALRDVDFRRGTNGEGRIVVELSDNSTGIDIRQQGRLLIVDFIGAAVPRNLERRLDVQDFATPVVSVDTLAQGGNARRVCGSTRPTRRTSASSWK